MAQTKMITPQSSLLKYDSPILISKTTDINLDELLKVTQIKNSSSVIIFLNRNRKSYYQEVFEIIEESPFKKPDGLLTLMS